MKHSEVLTAWGTLNAPEALEVNDLKSCILAIPCQLLITILKQHFIEQWVFKSAILVTFIGQMFHLSQSEICFISSWWNPKQWNYPICWKHSFFTNFYTAFESETNSKQTGWNAPWVVLYKMCFFCVDQKSKMATITGHRTIWENEKLIFSETKNVIELKLNKNNH